MIVHPNWIATTWRSLARPLVVAAMLAAPLASAHADGDAIPKLLRAIQGPPASSGGVAGGGGGYAAGFEPDEGFSPNFIGGNGSPAWSAFPTSSTEPHVDVVNPAAGTQHLRIAHDPGTTRNTFTGALGPDLGPRTPGPVTASVDVAISATGGARYDVLLQAPSQTLITARIRFDRFGNILVVDNLGPGFQFVDTGVDWVPGPYFSLAVCIDPSRDSIQYLIDGEPFYESVAGIFAADTVEQIALLSNNNQQADRGDFDNVLIEDGLACEDDTEPAGDGCDDCIPIGDGTIAGTTIGATGDADLGDCAFADTVDRWYCYTASCSGLATASTCDAADFDTTLVVFDVCDGLELACNDDSSGCFGFTSEVTWPVVAGATYLVRVAGLNESFGDFALTVDCTAGGPANDDCDAALTIDDGPTPFDTTDATTDGPAHDACLAFGDDQVNQDIWFDYTAACTGELTVSTCDAANFDTRLAVYAGTSCPVTDERLLACNDDGTGCANFTSFLSLPVVLGQSYKIRLGAFGTATGSGVLTVLCDLPGGPENNTCGNALEIEEGSTEFDSTTATTTGIPVGCAAFAFGDDQIHNDLWYRYTATCTGELFVSTCGTSDFDTRLAIYQGVACPVTDAVLIACNDDADGCALGSSSLVASVVAGQQYTIRLGGFSADDSGTGTLQVTFSPVLVLEASTKPDGFQVGETVSVQLRMANLCGSEAAGFEASLEFDAASLQLDSGAYTAEPFGLHLIDPVMADGGTIALAASVDKAAGQAPSSADAVLATLQFSALVAQCRPEIGFAAGASNRLLDAGGQGIEPLQLIGVGSCTGDSNGDGTVNVDDLVAVILAWGTVDCSADLNGDGAVTVDDLVAVIIAWGPCPDL